MDTNLLLGYYSVCHFCKEGKFNLIETDDVRMTTEFEELHITHGVIEIIPGAKFLTENLSQQYIDCDRPDLQPISTTIGPVDKKDIIESFKSARTARSKYVQQGIKKEIIGFQFFPIIYDIGQFGLNYELRQFTREELLIPNLLSYNL